jgi:hypothetical protein
VKMALNRASLSEIDATLCSIVPKTLTHQR